MTPGEAWTLELLNEDHGTPLIKESNPMWDEGKQRIVGKTPAGIFDRRYADLESDRLAKSLQKWEFVVGRGTESEKRG